MLTASKQGITVSFFIEYQYLRAENDTLQEFERKDEKF